MEHSSRGVCLYSCVSESDPGQTAPDPGNVPGFCVAWRHGRWYCYLLASRIHLQRGMWFCSLLQVKFHVVFFVPSVQEKWRSLKFFKSWTGSHVTYNCHHNSSRFTYPIFVHSWRFSVFHSLQSITPPIYKLKTSKHSLNLKLKYELYAINFPSRVAC